MTNENPLSQEDIAKAVAQTVYQKDLASQHLGLALKDVGPGYATMTLRVADYMLNGHGICHGGYIFTLADTAFAYACNSYNFNAVAQGAQISFLKAVPNDTLLTATAEEMSRTGRTGVYDIRVENEEKQVVALFRGNSYRIKGQAIPGLTGEQEK